MAASEAHPLMEPPFPATHQLNAELDTPPHGSAHGVSTPYLPGYPRISLQNRCGALDFLEKEYCSADLDRMAGRLWWMSKQDSANISPFHRQLVKRRSIIVTEDPKLHLVWIYDRIFVKPLPRYLTSYAFWRDYLGNDADVTARSRYIHIRKAALGYLRTYFYLVRSESDFYIAQDPSLHLVPIGITWEQFCNFTTDLAKIPDRDVSRRYAYGEIRLTRLNFYAPLLLRKSHFQRVEYQYREYFARFYGPVLFIIGITSIVLSGLQVAVAVEEADPLLNGRVLLVVALWYKAPEEHMFPQNKELPDVIWAFSPKGWTDEELATDWLHRIFVPQTARKGKHSILILDNHKSYTTGEFQYYCLENNIHPLYLPSHATHKLQPLDVDPFSPLTTAYGRAVEEYTPTGIATLNRSVFSLLYVQARQTAFTQRNIRAGWKRAGIWPINRQKLLDDPEIKNFGRTTPEYQPAPVKEGPNHLHSTPKKANEIRELQATIEAKVTPRTRRSVRKLSHAALQEHAGAQLLQNELNDVRRQLHHQELKKRSKRMAKENVQRSWNLEQVKAAREGRPPSRVQITRRTENSLRIVILSDKLE
ncbi:hypothetical protein EPUS_05850 [Endocarpon pusillum Z07020]|uniref:DDE-1 domain-containing protein n=1 Tax=Endocarpon pusillum (strain Z07020 / HMAS-L-300199) TaxID=1263415 RepID=U1GFZ8_ENDPU|nr:uncharacterized protein EPUS_05850 [Endocarpon pusillum Z07020]ERF76577.1 hypothetical protein EPUS_05850 [Endocarpon pusillum Z07020]